MVIITFKRSTSEARRVYDVMRIVVLATGEHRVERHVEDATGEATWVPSGDDRAGALIGRALITALKAGQKPYPIVDLGQIDR